jgi:NAD+ kinase
LAHHGLNARFSDRWHRYGPMKKSIKTIGLFGKYQDESVVGHVLRLHKILAERGIRVLIDEDTSRLLPEQVAPAKPLAALCTTIDLAIVIGGDGTLLHVARQMAPCGVPIIGVNLGRLGFLADITPDVMGDQIGRILDGDYQLERRLLLHVEIMRKGKIVQEGNALNDVVISKGEIARLIEFEIYLGGEFVIDSRADGIIVSSPTGSTAYAMSAGGPILHPTLAAISLVPICPHTLSFRPIVVSSDSTVEIVIIGQPAQARVTCDGQVNFPLEVADRIYVRRAENPVELLHPVNRSHFDVLRAKLFWGK